MKENYKDISASERSEIGSWDFSHRIYQNGIGLAVRADWAGDSRFDGTVVFRLEDCGIGADHDCFQIVATEVQSDCQIKDHVWMLSDAVNNLKEYIDSYEGWEIDV